ncbi:NIF family HAD-type phosphatase [Helcococcus ovis]|uniref:HAD family hydrolase n=1 Tax=Helcococcus ovis TaxID=72026 RepID=A0A4R9C065_9FIRM|nr:NIF family HAD-type phosphatase [Helcococcus ovis]TFF63894.1 HAD family hydrolase [Helcococcus ovis]TFF64593.1 HAD family hydrolase [Helcococcus ovis]TFF67887.1 HAD family hydrolase [Helcococcus ovis]WNZ01573.1 NIF family HAD-type phosphatase [Helcococcus ovis]
MKKKLVFDMDGTLFNTMGMWMNIIEEILNHKELINDLDPMETRQDSMIDFAYGFIKEKLREYDKNKVLRLLHNYFINAYSKNDLCKENVKEKLAELHNMGYEIYLATATDFEYANTGITSNGLKHYFKDIFTPDTIHSSKHHISYYEKILNKLETQPENIVFFDDSMYANEFANKIGFTSVAVFDKHTNFMEENIKISNFYIENFNQIDDKILK